MDASTCTLPALETRYAFHEIIGTGGSAVVYSASVRDGPERGRSVAIKVLLADLVDGPARARFERECAALRALAGEPGVIDLLDAGVVEGRAYVVSPRFASTYAERVASVGPLPPAEVIAAGIALADALAAAHAHGVLHRDVKPSNVFLRQVDRDHAPDVTGGVVLGDFGIATVGDDRTITGSLAMSLAYAAPEVVDVGTASEASDLYGLGGTLYHLLTGRPPIDVASTSEAGVGLLVHRIITERPARVSRDDVPDALRDLVAELLAKRPRDRPPSAAAVARRLRALGDADGASAVGGGSAARRTLLVAGVATFGVALGVWALLGSPAPSRPVTAVDASALELDAPVAPSGPAQPGSAPLTERPGGPAVPTIVLPRDAPDRVDGGVGAVSIAPIDTAVPPPVSGPVGAAPTTGPAAVPPTVRTPAAPPVANPVTPATDPPPPSTDVSPAVGPCGPVEVVVCSGFEAGLDGWNLRVDPSVAALDTASTGARSGERALAVAPGGTAAAGGSYAVRTVVLADGADGVTVRAWMRFGADGGPDWFMNVLSISTDAGALWNVDARPASSGGVALSTYHQDGTGGSAGDYPGVSIASDTWHCVTFTITPGRSTVVEVAVDGVAVAVVDDPIAATIPETVIASIGPTWLSPADRVPPLLIDDVAIGTPGAVAC